MSTLTTARGALLRRAGTLLVAAALVGAPATSAFADPTAGPSVSPTVSPSAEASPTASASASPSPSATATATGEPSPTTIPSASTSPSPSDPAPSPSPSASPTETTSPAAKAGPAPLIAPANSEAAAAFIASTLAAGDDHYNFPEFPGFPISPDVGNTIDAIIALSAVGTEQAQADASLGYLEHNVNAYIGSGGEVYAGPLAKTLLATVVTGADPSAFGGHDLVSELQDLETTEGRFSDDSAFGDFSNTIGHSLAVIALSRSGAGLNAPSVRLLLDQQCADGGFRGAIDDRTGCVSDNDATAFAVQALLVASDTLVCGTGSEGLTTDAADAAAEGLDLLEAAQDPSGGLKSADGVLNANTTGLAAQAFAAGGRTAAADAAAGFITTLQYDDSSAEPLRGGVAFSADTRSSTAPSDSDLRATPQATLGLAGGSLVDVLAPGVEGAGPGTECPPVATRQPVATPTATASPTMTVAPTTSSAPTEGAGGSDPSTPVDSSATGSLAQTGTDLLAPAMLGLLLVLVGGLAVWASSRRRGAHA